MIHEAKSFLVIVPSKASYGLASTLEAAIRRAKSEGGIHGAKKVHVRVIAFSCPRENVHIEAAVDLSYVWPKDHTAIKFDTVA